MRGPRPALVWPGAFGAVTAAASAAATAQVQGLEQADARVADAVVITGFVVAGAVILTARPGHRVGLLLWGGGALWGYASLPLELATAQLVQDPAQRGAALVAVLALAVRATGWILVVTRLALLFPDGRLPSDRWRPALYLARAALVLFVLAALLAPEPLDYRLEGVRNPIGLPEAARLPADLLAILGLALVVVSAVIGCAAAASRWRHGDALLRQRVGALALAAGVTVVVGAVIVADVSRTAVAFPLAVAALPVAVAVAVLQHGLYDVRLAVNRTLVYGALTAAVVTVYVLVVGGAGAVLQDKWSGWLSIVAAAIVALAFQPLRDAVQRSVNRLTYGAWDEPAEVVARLGERLADAAAPDSTLPSVVEALSSTLRLPYVAVVGADGAVLAEHGAANRLTRDVPLVHQRVPVGALRLAAAQRPGAAPREVSRERLLEALAHQLAPVVRALELARALQTSRERLVLAREEERRRLRRDLHDGLGPSLAGLTLRVDTARNTVGRDPAVDQVLRELRSDVQEAVADIRRVVEDLRPPALDELGLAGALEALTRRLAGTSVQVALEAPSQLPALPAAVEVAAYRIAQEAVSNALRHAAATRVCIHLRHRRDPPALEVSVEDDGCGCPSPAAGARGNGLGTMRERAEEIGGRLAVNDRAPRGTSVTAVLPVTTRDDASVDRGHQPPPGRNDDD